MGDKGSKDKGEKKVKKQAKHSIKEKRQLKKDKAKEKRGLSSTD